MNISEKVQADIVMATKAGDKQRLTTLLMVKSALKDKDAHKREPLTDAEERKILTTLITQRKEAAESLTKDREQERAKAEMEREVAVIDAYLPHPEGYDEIRKLVHGAIAHLQKDAGGIKPGPKDMDTAIEVAQQWIRAAGLQADRKLVSDIVKQELAK